MELISPKLAAAAVSLRTIVGMDQKLDSKKTHKEDSGTKAENAITEA
jgi:hypothetical protein